MYLLLIESQPGNYGPMDFLYDTNAEDIMVAVDVRDFKGTISPQYSNAAVLLTYPDDFVWLFSGREEPQEYSYVKPFPTWADYCTWVNTNTIK